jgi:hypothetical protein
MNTHRSATSPALRVALAVTALFLAGCGDSLPTMPPMAAARSGSDLSVTSTDPNKAHQDTTLDVRVVGSGFDQGSRAEWAIAGVPTAKVRTNSTRFVNSKELVANITIALDADPVLYDVQVITSRGKKGIGTELFQVQPIPAIAFARWHPAGVRQQYSGPRGLCHQPRRDGAPEGGRDHRRV